MVCKIITSAMMISPESVRGVRNNFDVSEDCNSFSLFLLLCFLALQVEVIVQVCPIDMVRILFAEVLVVCITLM